MQNAQLDEANEARSHIPSIAAILALVTSCIMSFSTAQAKVADQVFLNNQKTVYDLLWRPDQPEMNPEWYSIGKSYDIQANLPKYNNQVWVKEFLEMKKQGLLPRREIFSVFYPRLLDQAKALFKVFYASKDVDTFFKTAAWAKVYVNEGLFVYAFSVAVFHYPGTFKIRVPAVSEIYPGIFFDTEVIRTAQDIKASTNLPSAPGSSVSIIQANRTIAEKVHYFGNYEKLSYFTEDIEANDVLYYSHLAQPFWLSTEEFPDVHKSRGDRIFWSYRLHLARYYMERLCNDLGEVEDFDWDYPIPYAYFPDLSYRNGRLLPHREENSRIPSYNHKWIKNLKEWEQRISTAIDTGAYIASDGSSVPFLTKDGVRILGDLVEGTASSPNPALYGSWDRTARTVLGFSPEPFGKFKVLPSLLQFYGVDQRDPMYWSMIKKILGFWEQFQSRLPKYTAQELGFPGVKVQSVKIDKMTTYFSSADYLISNAVKVASPTDKPTIKARKDRLNHKPYTYTVTVQSDIKTKAGIRTFLGPKYDVNGKELDITENWKHFMILDEWVVDLVAGTNTFTRNSDQAPGVGLDAVSGDVFYKKILGAIAGKETYEIPARPYDYPNRMIIPKGKREGFPYQLLVFVSPYKIESLYRNKSPLVGEKQWMIDSLGFPLDRPASANFIDLPNVYVQEFKVYHVNESETNKTI